MFISRVTAVAARPPVSADILPDRLSRRAEKKQKTLMEKLRAKGVDPVDYAVSSEAQRFDVVPQQGMPCRYP